MKSVTGFFAGVLLTTAVGAVAQCLPDGEMTPMVRIFDMRSKQELLLCKVTITMLEGHRIMCDRGSK